MAKVKSGKSYLDEYAKGATDSVNEAGRALHNQMKQAKKNLDKF
jgi:hypothetical protein